MIKELYNKEIRIEAKEKRGNIFKEHALVVKGIDNRLYIYDIVKSILGVETLELSEIIDLNTSDKPMTNF